MGESFADKMKRVENILASSGTPKLEEESAESEETLRQVVANRSLASEMRRTAFTSLAERWQGEPKFSNFVQHVILDPDVDLACEAIRHAPSYDVKVLDRLHELLDDPRDAIASAAASSLARKKDRAVLPKMMLWVQSGVPHRRRDGLAAVAFLLIPEEHLAFVESICEIGPIDDDDEQVLIEALKVAEMRVAFWRKALKLDEGDSG